MRRVVREERKNKSHCFAFEGLGLSFRGILIEVEIYMSNMGGVIKKRERKGKEREEGW
jgi:hypothetical protein